MVAPVSRPPELTDQAAVVTGTAGGIGKATCTALAREGANILAADIEGSDLDAITE